MSIPKIIHYCWFGKAPFPDKVIKCIESWRKYCPDYQIKLWNEDNYNINKTRYISEAYKEKKWAFVSDYVRIDVVCQYGGVYLDTDVELKKSLDDLLDNDAFFAIEKQNSLINTGLGFGAVANNKHLLRHLELYESMSFYKEDGDMNLKPCPLYTTEYFSKLGYMINDVTQKIDGAIIYSSEYFCPINFKDGKMKQTENTIGIHWYDASWFSDTDKHIHTVEMKIRKTFPGFVAKVICIFYRNGYRFIEYLHKGVLLKKIEEKIKKVF